MIHPWQIARCSRPQGVYLLWKVYFLQRITCTFYKMWVTFRRITGVGRSGLMIGRKVRGVGRFGQMFGRSSGRKVWTDVRIFGSDRQFLTTPLRRIFLTTSYTFYIFGLFFKCCSQRTILSFQIVNLNLKTLCHRFYFTVCLCFYICIKLFNA